MDAEPPAAAERARARRPALTHVAQQSRHVQVTPPGVSEHWLNTSSQRSADAHSHDTVPSHTAGIGSHTLVVTNATFDTQVHSGIRQ